MVEAFGLEPSADLMPVLQQVQTAAFLHLHPTPPTLLFLRGAVPFHLSLLFLALFLFCPPSQALPGFVMEVWGTHRPSWFSVFIKRAGEQFSLLRTRVKAQHT